MKEVHHFFVYGMLPEIVGSGIRGNQSQTAKALYPHSIASTKPTDEGKQEDEDYSSVWCYMRPAKFWYNDYV